MRQRKRAFIEVEVSVGVGNKCLRLFLFFLLVVSIFSVINTVFSFLVIGVLSLLHLFFPALVVLPKYTPTFWLWVIPLTVVVLVASDSRIKHR
jgi:hypothetical protein